MLARPAFWKRTNSARAERKRLTNRQKTEAPDMPQETDEFSATTFVQEPRETSKSHIAIRSATRAVPDKRSRPIGIFDLPRELRDMIFRELLSEEPRRVAVKGEENWREAQMFVAASIVYWPPIAARLVNHQFLDELTGESRKRTELRLRIRRHAPNETSDPPQVVDLTKLCVLPISVVSKIPKVAVELIPIYEGFTSMRAPNDSTSPRYQSCHEPKFIELWLGQFPSLTDVKLVLEIHCLRLQASRFMDSDHLEGGNLQPKRFLDMTLDDTVAVLGRPFKTFQALILVRSQQWFPVMQYGRYRYKHTSLADLHVTRRIASRAWESAVVYKATPSASPYAGCGLDLSVSEEGRSWKDIESEVSEQVRKHCCRERI